MDRFGPAGCSPLTALPNGQEGAVDEDLATGQEGTNVLALWGNAVTEELMSILAAAGTTPNIYNWGQVLGSLQTLFGGGGAVVSNGWQKLPGGLIIQWMVIGVPVDIYQAALALPVSFPNDCFGAVIALNAWSEGTLQPLGVVRNPTNSGELLFTNPNTSTAPDGCFVIALGN